MKVNLIEVPVPMITEFQVFARIPVDTLKEKKTVRVSPRHVTKTRISTSIQIGNSRNKVNFKIDGFKTFDEENYSMFDGQVSTSNYFVKSKKQGLDEYKEYVKQVVRNVINNLNIELDEVTIELEASKF